MQPRSPHTDRIWQKKTRLSQKLCKFTLFSSQSNKLSQKTCWIWLHLYIMGLPAILSHLKDIKMKCRRNQATNISKNPLPSNHMDFRLLKCQLRTLCKHLNIDRPWVKIRISTKWTIWRESKHQTKCSCLMKVFNTNHSFNKFSKNKNSSLISTNLLLSNSRTFLQKSKAVNLFIKHRTLHQQSSNSLAMMIFALN